MAGYVKKVEEELLERVHSAPSMSLAELDAIAEAKEKEHEINYQLNVDKFIEFSSTLCTHEKIAFLEMYMHLTQFIFSVNNDKTSADERVKTLQDKIKKLAIDYFKPFKNAPSIEDLNFDESMDAVLEFSKDLIASSGFEWAPLLYQITGVIKISI